MSKAFRILAIAILATTAMPATSPAQPPAPSLPDSSSLSWIVGDWRGNGTMMGNASEAVLEVRPALERQFLELRLRMGPGFEGRAYYRALDGNRWRGHWLDSRGSSFDIEAAADGRVLTANWGSESTGRGRSVYRLLDDGRLEVADSIVARDGSPREFARHVLSRTSAAASPGTR
ncbi:MAG: hypothetical protein AB7O91_09780 [Sphingomonas sp.]